MDLTNHSKSCDEMIVFSQNNPTLRGLIVDTLFRAVYLSRSGQRFSVGGHAFYPIAVGDATEAKFDLAIHEMNDPNIWNVPKAWLVRNYFM